MRKKFGLTKFEQMVLVEINNLRIRRYKPGEGLPAIHKLITTKALAQSKMVRENKRKLRLGDALRTLERYDLIRTYSKKNVPEDKFKPYIKEAPELKYPGCKLIVLSQGGSEISSVLASMWSQWEQIDWLRKSERFAKKHALGGYAAQGKYAKSGLRTVRHYNRGVVGHELYSTTNCHLVSGFCSSVGFGNRLCTNS